MDNYIVFFVAQTMWIIVSIWSGKEDSYDIYADDKLIANVKLKEGKKLTRLGLLTFNEIEIDKITADNEKGLFHIV